ncbi:hypothetical protein B0H17DRAFT_1130312 [Mycena rosella]|uniref:Transmembrane protein n=1 Tax=Mycena rosella TaxID=1033263 RepID=A0AAD7DRL5_MYCRO|nr:hypothetical protein B0H17DRAFT_1130312 [Mycena rosella]
MAVWAKGLEHQLIFSVEHQAPISFLATSITTIFGTIYCAILVYVTQTLAIRRNLEMNRTLTATHDTAAAWAGIGSATIRVWRQKTIPASVFGVFTVFLYLGNITTLHITTPSLFSLQTFNFSYNVTVFTQGLPNSNFNPNNTTSMGLAKSYALGVLTSLPFIENPHMKTAGLERGTLYDVPELPLGSGNITVQGTGFNITCASVSDGVNTDFALVEAEYHLSRYAWMVEFPEVSRPFEVYSTQPGVIAFAGASTNYTYFYTTVPILDSRNSPIGSWVNLSPPMHSSTSSVAFFRCFQSLVPQTATSDYQFGRISTFEPTIHKTSAIWPSSDWEYPSRHMVNLAWHGTRLWGGPSLVRSGSERLTAVGRKLLSLGLFSGNAPDNATASLTLHDVENGISGLVATMFWAMGHISRPVPNVITSYMDVKLVTTTEFPDAPFLVQDTATATQMYPQTRLNASGLSASIALTVLALPFMTSTRNRRLAPNIPIDGTGLLHAIWLYRNHPELETHLSQVDYPTEENLRKAGMLRWKELREVHDVAKILHKLAHNAVTQKLKLQWLLQQLAFLAVFDPRERIVCISLSSL